MTCCALNVLFGCLRTACYIPVCMQHVSTCHYFCVSVFDNYLTVLFIYVCLFVCLCILLHSYLFLSKHESRHFHKCPFLQQQSTGWCAWLNVWLALLLADVNVLLLCYLLF
jgi:hypothetical protein